MAFRNESLTSLNYGNLWRGVGTKGFWVAVLAGMLVTILGGSYSVFVGVDSCWDLVGEWILVSVLPSGEEVIGVELVYFSKNASLGLPYRVLLAVVDPEILQ